MIDLAPPPEDTRQENLMFCFSLRGYLIGPFFPTVQKVSNLLDDEFSHRNKRVLFSMIKNTIFITCEGSPFHYFVNSDFSVGNLRARRRPILKKCQHFLQSICFFSKRLVGSSMKVSMVKRSESVKKLISLGLLQCNKQIRVLKKNKKAKKLTLTNTFRCFNWVFSNTSSWKYSIQMLISNFWSVKTSIACMRGFGSCIGKPEGLIHQFSTITELIIIFLDGGNRFLQMYRLYILSLNHTPYTSFFQVTPLQFPMFCYF